MRWIKKKEVDNGDVVFAMIVLFLCGFGLAYSHWGAGLPWF